MSSPQFDYAIVGAGAAGLQLAIALVEDPYFSGKKILIADPSAKDQNDRTWCFWEIGKGRWDDIIYQKWDRTVFHTGERQLDLDISPYTYKMLRSKDFYSYCKEILNEHSTITWIEDEITNVQQGQPLVLAGKEKYTAGIVFDSRIHQDFNNEDDSSIRLLQHFKGWVIEADEDIFDPEQFVMMDYRLIWNRSTSFTYILPFSKRKALVEFTLFSADLLKDEEYDKMLKKYISTYLKLSNYRISEVEKGIIPMTDFPFHRWTTANHIRIGTAGSWVKPSSGYSFHNSGKNVSKIIENLKAGRDPSKGLLSKKFRFYDSIFLNVLYNHNDLGPSIFSDMYTKNRATRILKFLDEETSIAEDLGIMLSFQSGLFSRAMLRTLFR
jgi:lycopene beta-cyclase